ncbi:hypothetical protein SaO408_0440 [Staphylococcus aureus]|nr:hypothetical protein SaO408_0440 [Staphylococcus aureus]
MQMPWNVSSSRQTVGAYREDLKAELIDQVGYFIEPQDLFSAMIREIETQDFDIEHLVKKVVKMTLSDCSAIWT